MKDHLDERPLLLRHWYTSCFGGMVEDCPHLSQMDHVSALAAWLKQLSTLVSTCLFQIQHTMFQIDDSYCQPLSTHRVDWVKERPEVTRDGSWWAASEYVDLALALTRQFRLSCGSLYVWNGHVWLHVWTDLPKHIAETAHVSVP